ncbi:MAG: L,D-transpeptidase [Tepidanaerobacteraceae bacterium]|nr:L,D-transpeptidase [Thermoanaerobacterales bacterium]
MRYFKLVTFIIVLALVVLLPLVTGNEAQSTQAIQETNGKTQNESETPEEQLPMPSPDKIFPDMMTVLNASETQTVNIKESPSANSKSLGVVFGDLMHVDVIKHLDSGFSEISTWDYYSMKNIRGFVPTEYIKEIKLDEKFGVVVDLGEQKVYVYQDDHIIKSFLCSTGLDSNDYNTPTGLYRLGARGESFYNPKYKQGAYYWVRFNNNYLFHSIPYDENENFIEEEAAKLGQKASHGCIRLSLEDSIWFYENVTQGTPVLIKN